MEVLLAKNFQANQKDHVLWFQKMFQVMKVLQDPMNSNSQINLKKFNPDKILKENPMKIKVDKVESINFPMIHMAIGLRYAEAVLQGRAWIPEPQQDSNP